MKIICAGLPKTGTKSMVAALQQLGYGTYDFMEHVNFHGNEWLQILERNGTTEDFRKMYSNVDVVADVPAAMYWDEIHKAFPDSKIILTLRDEEDWFNSFGNQIAVYRNNWRRVFMHISPNFWWFNRYSYAWWTSLFGMSMAPGIVGKYSPNEMGMKMKFRRHNAHVLQNAPKDKLLVYNVKEGWEPLCKFLDIEVPSTPFPHENVKGVIINTILKENPLFVRIQREIVVIGGCLFLVLSYGGYRLFKSSPSTWLKSCCGFLQTVIKK